MKEKHRHNFKRVDIIRGGMFSQDKIIYVCEDKLEPRGQKTKTIIKDENGKAMAVSISPPTHYEKTSDGCGELRSV